MDETSRAALDVLRSDENVAWIAEQLIRSFSEGITQSAKESGAVAQSDAYGLEPISLREKTKREKYETSRPYEESEKLELIRFALAEAFVTIPSMQNASAKALADLGSTASLIEFTAPDEEERAEGSYTRKLSDDPASVAGLRKQVETFSQKLTP
jgi:hypothetical protein